MHYDPKCSLNKHKCRQVCVSSSCSIPNPFICDRCENKHKSQDCKIITYNALVKKFRKINGTYTNQLLKFEQRVQNTFSQLMDSLKHHFMNFREEIQYLNVNPKIQDIYFLIKNKREGDLTGKMINKAYLLNERKNERIKIKDELTMRMQKDDLHRTNNELLRKLPSYYSLKAQLEQQEEEIDPDNKLNFIQNNYMYKRKVVKGILNQHFAYLEQMIKTPFYNIQMLYRASEHDFSAEAFHKKCDGIPNTITIAKTEYDKIVIGYSCFPWSSPNKWQYRIDNKSECFLISPHQPLKNRKFTPTKTQYAIGMHRDYGPCFGDDFVIYNKAHNSKNCWSNFPDVYTCKQRAVAHSQQTIKAFVGVSDHFQKFNLVQWEVYKVSFQQNEQIERSFMRQYREIPQSL